MFLPGGSETAWEPAEGPSSRCYGVTSGRVLTPMGHNYGRDNVKKRAVRRKKAERLAAAKKKKKTAK
ncbi:MAG: hypothetical protein DMF42_03660 [Verrucomicrobia bacterium]|nr:MAG: hypothetical protein DMF42_03660 [Verrucomicrobiota bacterium]